jgi:hypothetical protein
VIIIAIMLLKREVFPFFVWNPFFTCNITHTIVNSNYEKHFLFSIHDDAYGNAYALLDSRNEKVEFLCLLNRLSGNRTAYLFEGC